MKPDWDKLIEEFKDSKTALVADVDCTKEGKDLCAQVGVSGYPTLKWGDPSALEDYQGGRDLDSLRTFASENLKPMCSPKNIDLCDDEKKAEIEKLQAMDPEELDKLIKEKEQKIEDAETFFKDEVGKLQSAYQQLQEDKEKTVKEVKASGLSLLKAVSAYKQKKAEEKEEL